MTNVIMSGRTGSEIATAELALALRARGHRVAIYTPGPGELALELMARGIPVTDRIDRIAFAPDIIHGSHNVAMVPALICFPSKPGIFVCHDSSQSFDAPILSDRIGMYVAVDAACVERLVVSGVAEARTTIIANGVDLARFQLRQRWADRPRRALAITKARAPYIEHIREACGLHGITLDVVGPSVGRIVDDLPDLCAAADVVFASSRSAMEAGATGAAVVMCDEHGFGGLLRPREVEEWPDTLLSRRLWRGPVTVAALRAALSEYDQGEVARFAHLLRDRLSLDRAACEYERVYRKVLRTAQNAADARGNPDGAFAAFVTTLLPRFGALADYEQRSAEADSRRRDFDDWFALYGAGETGLGDILFRRDGLGRLLLEEGWHAAEDWGVWSRESIAHLRLPGATVRRWRGEMIFRCSHFIPAIPCEENTSCVTVKQNGRTLARWQFINAGSSVTEPVDKRLSIPLWDVADDVDFRIAFHMPRSRSPMEAGESPDTRRLGLALRSVGALSTLLI